MGRARWWVLLAAALCFSQHRRADIGVALGQQEDAVKHQNSMTCMRGGSCLQFLLEVRCAQRNVFFFFGGGFPKIFVLGIAPLQWVFHFTFGNPSS